MAAYAYEAITIDDTTGGKGFTAANITRASTHYGSDVKGILITVETAPIRFTVDGTAPTSSIGHLLNIGDIYTCNGEDALKFRAIRSTSVSASIKCTYNV